MVVVVLNAPDHVMGADVGHVHIHVLILDEKTGKSVTYGTDQYCVS